MHEAVAANRVFDWGNIVFLALVHAAAILTLALAVRQGVPWQTLVLALVWLACSGLSITGGYHRLFSHRSYKCAWPMRLFYVLFGAAAVQNSVINWAADHRRHHVHTDADLDPYDARQGLWWSHMGWVLYRDPDRDLGLVSDLFRDRLVAWQHRYYLLLVPLTLWAAPAAIASLWGDPVGGALWAGTVRLVVQYHSTFCINSLAHKFGRRPFTLETSARDNGLVAIITMGEGYHNFHHKFPGDYRNGVRPLDFDPTKWLVGGLAKMGVTWDLKRVSTEAMTQAREGVIKARAVGPAPH